MRLHLTHMTAGLAVGITAAVVAAFATGAYLFSRHHFEALLDSTRASALAEGELVREALEYQMLEDDRTLIEEMVRSFGRQGTIESVMLLDHQGRVRYSSDPEVLGTGLSLDSPACQTCHLHPPEERTSSRVIEARAGSILRSVVPFRNREACHQCHDPAQGINGILILDRDVEGLRTAMNRDLLWMVAGSGTLALLLVATIAGILQLLVLRRLRRFETTARLIADGDLDRRVPDSGSDTISWLAREFNTMADSMTGLVSEVQDERERLETVINSIGDGIVVLDPTRNIIAANAAFLERTGHIREDVVGCGCREVAPGLCDTADCPTLECLHSGRPQVRICERRDGTGEVAWEEVHSSPIRGPHGEIVQVVEVWRDISDRRAAEAQLAESHRLASLGLLASGFSHELNTPLGTVLTCLEGILREARANGDDAPGTVPIEEKAAIAREQILRCRGITQHFLRLSRGQTHSGDIVEIGSVVSAVTRLMEPTARAHSVEIRVSPIDPEVRVRADEADLQHAIVNLLLNAIQASAPGSTISVEVKADTRVQLRVTDEGSGVPPEDLRRIFEPFFSLREGGTGLGLFLSLNFVRRWGGDIRAESVLNEGSTFWIDLPPLDVGAQPEVTS